MQNPKSSQKGVIRRHKQPTFPNFQPVTHEKPLTASISCILPWTTAALWSVRGLSTVEHSLSQCRRTVRWHMPRISKQSVTSVDDWTSYHNQPDLLLSASFILRNLHNTDQQDEIFAFEGESRVQLVLKNLFQQLLYPWVTLMLTALFCSIGVMHHAWVLSELLPWWFCCLCLRAVQFLLPAIVD